MPETESSTERNPVEVLAEEYLDRFRNGAHPTVEEFAAKHPECAKEISDLFPAIVLMEEISRSDHEISGTDICPDRTWHLALKRVGDYDIVRELGRGGMGVVYEAEQRSLRRRVAIKVLPRTASLSPSRRQRFIRESQAAAKLHHTNIVPVFGIGDLDGLHYYVMQLIEGEGLDQVIANLRTDTSESLPKFGGPEYWRKVAGLGRQVASALDYAHSKGILHRDIKPSNLLLDQSGTIWVTDFGLAKPIDQEDLTHTGDVVGTVRYMAPERLSGDSDAQSDVYELGLTIYELLVLRPAYEQSDRRRLLVQLSKGQVTRPRKFDSRIPRDLETIVLKALSQERKRRYATAGELADDLERYLEGRSIRARRAHLLIRCGRWCRRNPAVSSLSASVLLLLVVVASVGWIGMMKTKSALGAAKESEELSRAAFDELFEQIDHMNTITAMRGMFGRRFAPPSREEGEGDQLSLKTLDYYRRFVEQNRHDPEQASDVAAGYGRIGDLHREFGQANEAYRAYLAAYSMFEKISMAGGLVGSDSTLAQLHLKLGTCEEELDRLESADGSYRKALASYRILFNENPDHSEFLFYASQAVDFLHKLHESAGRLAESRAILEESVEWLEGQLVQDNPRFQMVRFSLSRDLGSLADVLRDLGETELGQKVGRSSRRYWSRHERRRR